MQSYTRNKEATFQAGLLKRLNARNIRARYEQMDIVRSFISNHRFEVHHVAHDGVLAGDAHAAVDLAGLAGHVQGHVHGVALGHADLGAGGLAFVFEHA